MLHILCLQVVGYMPRNPSARLHSNSYGKNLLLTLGVCLFSEWEDYAVIWVLGTYRKSHLRWHLSLTWWETVTVKQSVVFFRNKGNRFWSVAASKYVGLLKELKLCAELNCKDVKMALESQENSTQTWWQELKQRWTIKGCCLLQCFFWFSWLALSWSPGPPA